MNNLDEVLDLIAQERKFQDNKWGSQRHLHNDVWNRILGEEVGEVAKALNEQESIEALKKELVQVAAVATAWVEALSE